MEWLPFSVVESISMPCIRSTVTNWIKISQHGWPPPSSLIYSPCLVPQPGEKTLRVFRWHCQLAVCNEILCNSETSRFLFFSPCFQCARYSQNDVVHQLQDTRNYLHLARGGVLLIHKMGPQSVNMFLSMQKIAVHGHSVRCWARCTSTFSLSLSLPYIYYSVLQWNRLIAQSYSPQERGILKKKLPSC